MKNPLNLIRSTLEKTLEFATQRSRRFHLFVGELEVGQTWADPFGVPHRVEFIGSKGVRTASCTNGTFLIDAKKIPFTEMYRGWRQLPTAGTPEES